MLMQSKINTDSELTGDQMVEYGKVIDKLFKVYDNNNGKPIVIKRKIREILQKL
jgi:hypothetical protein